MYVLVHSCEFDILDMANYNLYNAEQITNNNSADLFNNAVIKKVCISEVLETFHPPHTRTYHFITIRKTKIVVAFFFENLIKHTKAFKLFSIRIENLIAILYVCDVKNHHKCVESFDKL